MLFIHLLFNLKFVVVMHQILEDMAEFLFLPLPRDSTTMLAQVEDILPNAASTPLQLWLYNVNSVWLPYIE